MQKEIRRLHFVQRIECRLEPRARRPVLVVKLTDRRRLEENPAAAARSEQEVWTTPACKTWVDVYCKSQTSKQRKEIQFKKRGYKMSIIV
jgi:hypothetical protein